MAPSVAISHYCSTSNISDPWLQKRSCFLSCCYHVPVGGAAVLQFMEFDHLSLNLLPRFGFVDFSSPEDAKAAKEAMEDGEIDGNKVTLDFAKPKGDFQRGGGFGGGFGGRGGGRGGRGGGRGGFGGRGGGRGFGGKEMQTPLL